MTNPLSRVFSGGLDVATAKYIPLPASTTMTLVSGLFLKGGATVAPLGAGCVISSDAATYCNGTLAGSLNLTAGQIYTIVWDAYTSVQNGGADAYKVAAMGSGGGGGGTSTLAGATDVTSYDLPSNNVPTKTALQKKMATLVQWNLTTNLATADDGVTTFTPANGTYPATGDNLLLCTGTGTRVLDGSTYSPGDMATYSLSSGTWVYLANNSAPVTTALFKGDGAGKLIAATPGIDYAMGASILRSIPVVRMGSWTFSANGVVNWGAASGPAATMLIGSAGASLTNGTYSAVATTLSQGSGVSLTLNITVSGGVVTAVSVAAGGGGYVPGSTVTVLISAIGGTGTAPTFTVGTVTAPTLTTSATTGSAITITGTGAFTGTGADVGKNISLDSGKIITITTAGTTGSCTGTTNFQTLSGTSFATWTLGYGLNYGSVDSAPYLPGCWVYFPANSISSSNAAGFYWYVPASSNMLGTVYNNTYVPGTSTGAPPTNLVAFSGAAGTVSYDSSFATPLVTDSAAIPANFLGTQGTIDIYWLQRNSAGPYSKSVSSKLNISGSGNSLSGISSSTVTNTTTPWATMMYCRGSNVQYVSPVVKYGAATTGQSTHGQVDTTQAQGFGILLSMNSIVEWVAADIVSVVVTPRN